MEREADEQFSNPEPDEAVRGADISAYGYRKTFCSGRENAHCINVHLDSALPEDWYQSMLHCRHTVGVNYGK